MRQSCFLCRKPQKQIKTCGLHRNSPRSPFVSVSIYSRTFGVMWAENPDNVTV